MNVARKPKRVGHFLGFFAVAAFPSAPSIRAYARSPRRPYCVTSVALSSSPSIDFTGYRHSETTEPSVGLGMLASPFGADPRSGQYARPCARQAAFRTAGGGPGLRCEPRTGK